MAFFRRDIPSDKIAELVRRATSHGDEAEYEKAWEQAKPPASAQY